MLEHARLAPDLIKKVETIPVNDRKYDESIPEWTLMFLEYSGFQGSDLLLQFASTPFNLSKIDSGWFYAALAQVNAAIFGLIGAVLGSRLIEHAQQLRKHRLQLVRVIDRKRQLKSREQTATQILDQASAILKNFDDTTTKYQYVYWNRAGGQCTRDQLWPNQSQLKEDLDFARRIIPALLNLDGKISINDISRRLKLIDSLDEFSVLPERDSFRDGITQELQTLSRQVRNYWSEINSKYYWVMVFVATLASIGTVIPLMLIEGFQGFPYSYSLIAILATLLLGVLGFFSCVLFSYRRLIPLQWNLGPEDSDKLQLDDAEKLF